MIHTADFEWDDDNLSILREIWSTFDHFKDKFPKLMEVITILQLALWKMKIYDNSLAENMTGHQKKIKTEESSI